MKEGQSAKIGAISYCQRREFGKMKTARGQEGGKHPK